MKKIEVIENLVSSSPTVTIVCCVHGDELFGKRVFNFYKKRIKQFSGLRIILANKLALQKRKRFIDSDLNRVFPGMVNGDQEEKMAAELFPFINDMEYLLDIHTTTSDIKMTPIVVGLSQKIKEIINATNSLEVVFMEKNLAQGSLIGQSKKAASLEFGEEYCKSKQAMKEIIEIVGNLLNTTKKIAFKRFIYYIDETIPLTYVLPKNSKNFKKIPNYSIYPFLLNERSYTTHQGFCTTKRVELLI